MLEIASGNQNLRAKETGAHELREVTRQFNAMLDQIDQLMADIRRQEETTRQYQLQALSSQINPHFLYNTLDTIIWMAEFQDSQRVVQVTKSLATYFRLALNQGRIFLNLIFQLIPITLFLDKEILADMIDFVRQTNPVLTLIERQAEIGCQRLGHLNHALTILKFSHPNDGVQGIIKEMRINLAR